ncbi:MAG: outer membrane protein assembly factor BamA [Planctomycetota bacterium]
MPTLQHATFTRILCLLCVGVFLSAAFVDRVAAQDSPRVVAIRFQGNQRYTDEVLREQIATKVGALLDSALLGQDERTLRRYFSAVTRIEEIPVEGGVEIVFHVEDRAIVGKVTVDGFKTVNKEDFLPLMTTRRGRPLHSFALKSDKELIERLQKEKGYHFAEVRYRTEPTKDKGIVDVYFDVYPQRRIRVLRVVLEGAHSLDRSDVLRGATNSDRYRDKFLGIGKLLSPSYFDRAALDQDRRRIELIYQAEGYLDARVALVGVRFDVNREFATIHYRIDEGERYLLGDLEVIWSDREHAKPEPVDAEFLSLDRLAALAVFGSGDPYRIEDVRASRRRIEQRIWFKSYAVSDVEVGTHADPLNHTVNLTYRITVNRKVSLGRLRIVGNQFTRDNVIRRHFLEGAYPGEPLNMESVTRGESSLRRLNYFSRVSRGRQNQGLIAVPEPTKPNEYDLEFDVTETTTRSFNIGGAVSTDGGIVGNLRLVYRNFDIKKPPNRLRDLFDDEVLRGGGQQFTVSFAPGTTFSTFEIAFADPALRDSRWALRTSVARRLSRFDDYDQSTDGGSIRVGRFLDMNQRWRLNLDWSYRAVLISNPQSNAPKNALAEQGTTRAHGVGVSLTFDRRRELDVLRGWQITIGAQLFGSFLGADMDVFKTRLSYVQGWRMFETAAGNTHRLLLKIDVDYASGFGQTPEVPIFERYFAGGRNLRGFEFREVGPRSNGRPSGGEFRGLVTLDYAIPIATRNQGGISLDFVLFLDQGTLLNRLSDWTNDQWRITPGFGLAIGFGPPTQPPIHIDFGFPIQDVDGDVRQVFSFAFRRDF